MTIPFLGPKPTTCSECSAPSSAIWVNRSTGEYRCTNCGANLDPTPTDLTFLPLPEETKQGSN